MPPLRDHKALKLTLTYKESPLPWGTPTMSHPSKTPSVIVTNESAVLCGFWPFVECENAAVSRNNISYDWKKVALQGEIARCSAM